MTRLKINLLGRVEFKYDEKRLEHKLSNKGVALISLLMLDMGKKVTRDKLVSYLWADSDEEAARYNLRYNLWNIKKVIPADESGAELIISCRDYCEINPKYDFDSDLIGLMKAEKNGNQSSIEELNCYKELFRGDFLEGIYIKNCDEFNERVILERIVYQNKYVELLKSISDKYETYKNYGECTRVLSELVSIEPYNENFAYRQISVYAEWGKRSEAISCYKKFEASLRSNLNISPCQEIKLLYSKLMESPLDMPKEYPAKSRLKKQEIEIEVLCIENIDYFCISEIVRKIILKGDRKYIFGFSKCYLDDLNFIQLDVGTGYEKLYTDKCHLHNSLPCVRIVDAFFKFINYISEIYNLKIRIINPESIDSVSANAMNYIKQLEIKDLTLINI